ncbi:MAG: hypothetical protein BJ554DRAFT_6787, partial [Olpidium bornovanus]
PPAADRVSGLSLSLSLFFLSLWWAKDKSNPREKDLLPPLPNMLPGLGFRAGGPRLATAAGGRVRSRRPDSRRPIASERGPLRPARRRPPRPCPAVGAVPNRACRGTARTLPGDFPPLRKTGKSAEYRSSLSASQSSYSTGNEPKPLTPRPTTTTTNTARRSSAHCSPSVGAREEKPSVGAREEKPSVGAREKKKKKPSVGAPLSLVRAHGSRSFDTALPSVGAPLAVRRRTARRPFGAPPSPSVGAPLPPVRRPALAVRRRTAPARPAHRSRRPSTLARKNRPSTLAKKNR